MMEAASTSAMPELRGNRAASLRMDLPDTLEQVLLALVLIVATAATSTAIVAVHSKLRMSALQEGRMRGFKSFRIGAYVSMVLGQVAIVGNRARELHGLADVTGVDSVELACSIAYLTMLVRPNSLQPQPTHT